ncbi:LacI family DNA-binding transcriptional regulator [Flavobacteriaceae bacterium 3-367]|uniref:substrate-binding domain-containing protein n=1 Tax=Eudoraea algarum TaxID=3417568 RepID=UPI003294F0F7
MITIKEIAKLAEVSPGTVDRVIHNRQGVSEKTAKRIRGILEQHNFKVNRIAQSLALKKKYTIAVLLPDSDDENLFWKSPLEGICKAKDELIPFGVTVETFFFDQKDSRSYINSFKLLLAIKPQGVILVPTFKKETEELTNTLRQREIPFSFLNISINGYGNLSFIGQDAFKSGVLAGKLMGLCMGHKVDVLTVHSRPNLSNFNNISERIKGFDHYFEVNDLKNTNHYLELEDFGNAERVRGSISEILLKNPEIKGIFVPNSRSHIIANLLHGLGNPKPFLIGFDITEHNAKALTDGKITFLISQKPVAQGYRAIETLAKFLLYNRKPSSQILSPIEIITKENLPYADQKRDSLLSF